ncbi:Imm32 family immunity protein [Pseudomonas mercuritolerans]|uniref:Uncharacterized protein n=1 Tax=Pseudomonas mercuritolerans TaxID=2951809 RepID=A0ABT2Y2R4_9PSED|nr:hypothetical protein [Pseudomonas mercuritolerans]MCV2224949.1 hypothetical protein [Pseudomonas mercuritolerans]
MSKLNHFSVHGVEEGGLKGVRLESVSIVGDPETIREIGAFLIKAAEEMAKNGLEHLHLQDVVEGFDYEKNVDFIALNGLVVNF